MKLPTEGAFGYLVWVCLCPHNKHTHLCTKKSSRSVFGFLRLRVFLVPYIRDISECIPFNPDVRHQAQGRVVQMDHAEAIGHL